MTDTAHAFGWKPRPKDERDWNAARLNALVDEGTHAPVEWHDPVVLDQGQTPECVGFGGAGFVATAEADAPADSTVTNALGHAIYARCKAIDGDTEEGSNLRSLAKALGLLAGLHYNSTKLKAAIALLHQLEGMM